MKLTIPSVAAASALLFSASAVAEVNDLNQITLSTVAADKPYFDGLFLRPFINGYDGGRDILLAARKRATHDYFFHYNTLGNWYYVGVPSNMTATTTADGIGIKFSNFTTMTLEPYSPVDEYVPETYKAITYKPGRNTAGFYMNKTTHHLQYDGEMDFHTFVVCLVENPALDTPPITSPGTNNDGRNQLLWRSDKASPLPDYCADVELLVNFPFLGE